MPAPISRFLSQKLRFYTFICIALLLFVHGYNLNQTFLQPFTTVQEPLTFTSFFEYFVANGILRFRIPLLFIISGYIYALKDNQGYGTQVKKRAISLLIPYLIWSAIGLAITWLWQQNPVTARAVFESKLDQLGDNRPYAAIGWGGILFRWVAAPIAFQLWFILALFLYDVCYPLIRWLVTKYPIPWFIFTLALWAYELSFLVIDGRGLFFFSIGIWFQKMNVNLERKPKWISMYIAWLLFIGLSVIKTFMAFELDPESKLTYALLSILHSVSVIAGIIAVWYGADRVVKWCMRRPEFVWLTGFSFFIFGLHAPLVVYLTRLFYIFFHTVPNYRLMTYLVVPGIVFVFCVLMGAATRKLVPQLYRWATGGRGFRTGMQ
ncbi:MAG: acyltransferase [Chitinophagaceae bacterium]|nr:acyltransferase [Chitinophagaceae bacterium]